MHKDNFQFGKTLAEQKAKLEVSHSPLGIVSIEDAKPDYTQDDVLKLTDYLPKVETAENWWTRFLTPRVIDGNYQRKRELLRA